MILPNREGNSIGRHCIFNLNIQNRSRRELSKTQFLPDPGIAPGVQGQRPSTLSTTPSSHPITLDARIARLVKSRICNLWIAGSNPTSMGVFS